VAVLAAALGTGCDGRPEADEAALQAEIAGIRAIDNHAHPLAVTAPGQPEDTEYDALTLDEMEPAPIPVRVHPDNPEWQDVWRRLWQYTGDGRAGAHLNALLAAKARVAGAHGTGHPAWVIEQAGIETMFANRVAMGAGLTAPRFRWVSFVDALMFPLSSEALRRVNADYKSFYACEDRLLRRYLAESHVEHAPVTLAEYLSAVVTATLERQKRDGAVAVKFEAAYLRSLEFASVPEAQAAPIYARYVRGGEPPAAEYTALQDFLFRYIAREAGRLGLAVHIHSTGGVGGYYSLRTANPLLLESVFNDPALRKTTFVVIHGGWPYVKEVALLTLKPNVYADFSGQTWLTYPREMAGTLRSWLEMAPGKILFGTDAAPFAPEVNWEETAWLFTNSARRALAIALAGMMHDGEISHDRALELARAVLRDNAIRLYKLR
jgi:hypothetical protein